MSVADWLKRDTKEAFMVKSPQFGEPRFYRSFKHAKQFGRKGATIYRTELNFVEWNEEKEFEKFMEEQDGCPND